MAQATSPPFPLKDSSLSSAPSAGNAPMAGAAAIPDARAARNPQGHFLQPFKLAAVRYAASSGKSQRAAAKDLGIGDGTLGEWMRDAKPDAAGIVDAPRFDELAQLRAQNRELTARAARLTAERDFLKKVAGYFATPTNGGSR